jgi:hypothetical protein
MVEQRVSDRAFLHLIGKWLRAGIMEEGGLVVHPATGTPQGGIVSCVLANIYLHYVLDSWFEKQFKATCKGDAYLHRYADDTVAVFQYHGEAVRYFKEVQERFRKFGLDIARRRRVSKSCSPDFESATVNGLTFWALSFDGVKHARASIRSNCVQAARNCANHFQNLENGCVNIATSDYAGYLTR